LIALFTISISVSPSAGCVGKKFLDDIPILFLVIALYGVGIMFGMLLQFVGMKLGIITIHVWNKEDDRKEVQVSLEKEAEFQYEAKINSQYLRKRERLAVLKEMSGNYAIAFLVSIVSLVLRYLIRGDSPMFFTPVSCSAIGIISVVLIFQNKYLSREQHYYEKAVVEYIRKNLSKDEASA